MKRYFLILALLFFSFPSIAFCQTEKDSATIENEYKWMNLLHEKVQEGSYEEAYALMDSIDLDLTISRYYLDDIANCMIALEKYDECIMFCDQYINGHKKSNAFIHYGLDAALGECYYYKKDDRNAEFYLSKYLSYADENNFGPKLKYIELYAHTLNYLYEYDKAAIYYDWWLREVTEREEVTLETISQSSWKELAGQVLYRYAYNSFFQGDENKGANLLRLAVTCEYEKAIEDYNTLLNSPTFNKQYKYKNSTLRDFEEVIATYNFPSSSQQTNGSLDIGVFWDKINQNSSDYNKLLKAIQKNNPPSTLRDAVSELKKSKEDYPIFLAQLYPYKAGDFENNLNKSICGPISFLTELRIYPAKEANAFATPNGEVYLTEGLVEKMHFKRDLLIGICAHEVAHYRLQHTLARLWTVKKKEKKNRMWAGIAAGLAAASQVGSTMYAASNGVSYDQQYYNNMGKLITNQTIDIMDAFETDAYYFKFKYNRTQELESDLAAYRFCEEMGVGGYSYIMALQLIGDDGVGVKADKDSDHPTTAYRVGLLKHLFNKEHNIK